MGRVILGRGAASIELSGALAAQIEATIRRIAPTVYDRVDAEIEEIRSNAEARWPRGDDKSNPRGRNKGQPYHSADSFRSGVRIVTDGIEGFISNFAVNVRGKPYWFYIKTAQGGLRARTTIRKSKVQSGTPDTNAGSPINAYVKIPLKERTKIIAAELADEIRALVRR
jgi:hypothetical protein